MCVPGIGKAIVEELASLGATVLTCSRKQEALDLAIASWASAGLTVHGCVADVSKADDRQKLVATVSEVFGGRV